MAYPFAVHQGLTPEQAESLRELNSFHQASESHAWKQLVAQMQAMVDEAREESLGCAATTTLEQRGLLQIRWQQREAMQRGLLQFMESQLDQRNQIIEEIKAQEEPNEHTDSNA